MATNYIQDGATIPYTNSGAAISSGDVVVLADAIGIAETDIAVGSVTPTTGTLLMTGVFSLAANANVDTIGEDLYWDGSELTTVATSNTPAGICWAAVSGGLAQVKLGPTTAPSA